ATDDSAAWIPLAISPDDLGAKLQGPALIELRYNISRFGANAVVCQISVAKDATDDSAAWMPPAMSPDDLGAKLQGPALIELRYNISRFGANAVVCQISVAKDATDDSAAWMPPAMSPDDLGAKLQGPALIELRYNISRFGANAVVCQISVAKDATDDSAAWMPPAMSPDDLGAKLQGPALIELRYNISRFGANAVVCQISVAKDATDDSAAWMPPAMSPDDLGAKLQGPALIELRYNISLFGANAVGCQISVAKDATDDSAAWIPLAMSPDDLGAKLQGPALIELRYNISLFGANAVVCQISVAKDATDDSAAWIPLAISPDDLGAKLQGPALIELRYNISLFGANAVVCQISVAKD